MATNFPDGRDTFQALIPGPDGSRRDVPVGGRVNTGYVNDLGDAVEAIEDYLLDSGPAAETVTARLREGDTDHQDRKLFGWWRALSLRADQRAVILVVGDSRPEGQGIATVDGRWQNLLRDQLQGRHPTPDGITGRGYIPAHYGATGIAEAPVRTGNTATNVGAGLGLRSVTLGADTGGGVGMVTFDLVECNAARLWFTKYQDMGKSEYRVDGGSWVEVDHDNNVSSFDFEAAQTLVDLVTVDDHTIDWRWKSTGTSPVAPLPNIEGVEELNGTVDAGIGIIDAAHAGFTAANFLTKDEAPPQWVADSGASLCLIDLGTNEWQGSSHATIDDDIASYTENLTELIALLRGGNADLEVVLLGGWSPLDAVNPDADPQDWPRFVEAQYAIAAADPDTSVFDMRRFLPEPNAPGDTPELTGGLFDVLGLHPEERGHEAIASALADHLALPVGGAYGDPPAVRSGDVFSIVALTQDDYDALDPPLDGVLYVITDS